MLALVGSVGLMLDVTYPIVDVKWLVWMTTERQEHTQSILRR